MQERDASGVVFTESDAVRNVGKAGDGANEKQNDDAGERNGLDGKKQNNGKCGQDICGTEKNFLRLRESTSKKHIGDVIIGKSAKSADDGGEDDKRKPDRIFHVCLY